MRTIEIDPSIVKTYKTKTNLLKALDKLALEKYPLLKALIVEVDGRWTAVFTNVMSHDHSGMLRPISEAGFLVVG